MRRTALLLSLVTLLLAFPATAAADKPTTVIVPISFTTVNRALCGFPVTIVALGEARITTFSDGRRVTHRRVTVTYSANGRTVTNNQTLMFVDEDGQRSVLGNVFSINIPGEGLVVHDAGKLVFDLSDPTEALFAAGHHDAFPAGPRAICAYLAG